ncbi:MAG: DUF4290 domain-containing protein [Segetibacter sp.]
MVLTRYLPEKHTNRSLIRFLILSVSRKYSHLGKNLEVVIDKALKEENPEKRVGFANSIAYYMKLAYSNWHKELVHDDGIRAELNVITNGPA